MKEMIPGTLRDLVLLKSHTIVLRVSSVKLSFIKDIAAKFRVFNNAIKVKDGYTFNYE